MGKILRSTRRPGRKGPRYAPRRSAPFSSKAVRRVPFWLVLCVAVPVFAIIGALAPGQQQTLSAGSAGPPGATIARSANVLTGRASIVDGDTFVVNGQEVRLNGIDAPESSQRCTDNKGKQYRCGSVAARALDEFLAASRPTTCQFVEWDQYERFVGDCARADGTSVAVWMVRNGHAMDWPRGTAVVSIHRTRPLHVWTGSASGRERFNRPGNIEQRREAEPLPPRALRSR